MRLPTASKLELVERCPGSVRLPVIQETGAPAAHGTVVHGYLAGVATVGPDAALATVPDDYRAACEAIDLQALPRLDPEACAVEVAFGYDLDLDLGREVGRLLPRAEAYARLNDGEQGGTADLVALTADAVIVLDYKTGRVQVTPPARNLQLGYLALAASRAYERDRAIVGLIHLREGEEPSFSRAELDALELEGVRDRLLAIRAAIQDPKAPLHRGEWCRYCSAFDACPAQHELIQVAASAPLAVLNEAEVAISSPDGRAHAYNVWRQMELVTKRLGERIGAVASYRPIDLGDGRRYGLAKGKETVADPAVVRRVLGEVLDLGAAQLAVTEETTLSATKASITAALKGLKPKQREAVWIALRAAGALKVGETLKEHVAGGDSEEAA